MQGLTRPQGILAEEMWKKKLYFNRRYLNEQGGAQGFFSPSHLLFFGKIRVPRSGMTNLKIPFHGGGFGFLHFLKAILMRDGSEQIYRGSFLGLAPQ